MANAKKQQQPEIRAATERFKALCPWLTREQCARLNKCETLKEWHDLFVPMRVKATGM
jgi:hypothetical protein